MQKEWLREFYTVSVASCDTAHLFSPPEFPLILQGHLSTQTQGHLITLPQGHLITQTQGHMITRTQGHMITQTQGQLISLPSVRISRGGIEWCAPQTVCTSEGGVS